MTSPTSPKTRPEPASSFELIGARYERRSLLITANQPFRRMGQDLPRSGYDDPPVDFTGPISDAALYPRTSPLHTYHLGLWFNSPTDAQNASRPNAPTPFNGEHNTGIQVLNTSNFPDDHGPLRNLRADARTTGLVSVRGCCVSFWSPAY